MFAKAVRNSIRPPTAAATYTRQQHLDSYLNDPQLSPSTRKVSNDNTTFDTVFQSVHGDTLILRVHYGTSAHQPAMTLAGVEARHDWLDGRMRVTGYSPIQSSSNWKAAAVLLGPAIHAVIQHLQLHPPEIVRFLDVGLISIQPNKPPPHKFGPPPQGNNSQPPPPAYSQTMNPTRQAPAPAPTMPKINWPTVPTHFTQLDSINVATLEDELEFKAFCNRLPITSDYHDLQKKFLNENADAATKRLESETEWNELHSQVRVLQKELREKVEAFQTLEQEQDTICKPPDEKKMLKELQKAKQQAFDTSEQIADDWMDGDDSVEQFTKKFVESRKIHHLRAAKLELLEYKCRR